MAVATRDQLKDYALRALGAPVLEINVDDAQIEDRLDEALEYFTLYHYEGVEQMYMKQKVTASVLHVDGFGLSTKFGQDLGNTWPPAPGMATCQVTPEYGNATTATEVLCRNVQGTWSVGDSVYDLDGGNLLGTVTAGGMVLGNYDKKYFDLPDYVYGVTKVLNIGQASSSKNIFDLQYQLRLNDLYDLTSTSIVYYKTVMGHLAMLDLELNGHPLYRFNRMRGRLHLDVNYATDVIIGDYILVQGYRATDPSEFTKMFNEPWLKLYTTALFKRQWAINIKKFSGIQLPGGVTLDGVALYDEATKEIQELEHELMSKSAPLEFFMG